MPVIRLTTFINAPIETVFDLARSIELHQVSTKHTNEKVVGGRMSGLIELHESVTWEARHFGVVQRLTSKVTAFDQPRYFVDEMIKGTFHSFKHEHLFEENGIGTLMTDVFTYKSPLAILGRLADVLFLRTYMERLLVQRNKIVKEHAER